MNGPGDPLRHVLRAAIETDEREETLDATTTAHLSTCLECQEGLATSRLLRRELAHLPRPVFDKKWERALLAEIDGVANPTKAGWWARFIRSTQLKWAWGGLPVAIAIGLFLIVRPKNPPDALGLSMTFEPEAGKTIRARRTRETAAAGDLVWFEVSGVTSVFADVWVYEEKGGLRFHCEAAANSRESRCVREGKHLRARFQIPSVGRYRALLVAGSTPVAAVQSSIDDAVNNLSNQRDVVWLVGKPFEVW